MQSATRWHGKTYTFSSLPGSLRSPTSPWSPRGGLGKPKRDAAQKQEPFPSSVRFADSFPPRGSLGLSQTCRCGTPPCLPLWGRCPSAAKDGEGQERPRRPSQSALLTALPKGEPRKFCKSALLWENGKLFIIHYPLKGAPLCISPPPSAPPAPC